MRIMASKKTFCSLVLLLIFIIQGCASSPEKALIKKDLQSVNQIKVIRYEFPGYLKEATGSKVASSSIRTTSSLIGTMAMGGGILGALYGSVKMSMLKSAGKEMQSKYNLPDFTELVHKEFSAKLPQSVQGWPPIVIESVAVNDDYRNPSECILSIRSDLIVSDNNGLQTDTTAQLVDSKQNVLWEKHVSYKSSHSNQPGMIKELEADNAKELHKGIALATEITVSELINDLRNGTDTNDAESTEQKKTQ